jgi:hypothetical protein
MAVASKRRARAKAWKVPSCHNTQYIIENGRIIVKVDLWLRRSAKGDEHIYHIFCYFEPTMGNHLEIPTGDTSSGITGRYFYSLGNELGGVGIEPAETLGWVTKRVRR